MSVVPPLRVLLDESVPADLATVDALARMQLEARRAGVEVTLVGVPQLLRDLIDLIGLTKALRVES
jgi:ABC-type transporter Mla MlaB component